MVGWVHQLLWRCKRWFECSGEGLCEGPKQKRKLETENI